MQNFQFLGFGLGLRAVHYNAILNAENDIGVDWFEAISEDYLIPGGNPLHFLTRDAERYPIVLHGVSLSIGSVDPLDKEYLRLLKQLAERVNPKWISDHLCWTGMNGINLHDLMPLPYTEEALNHLAARIKQVQDYLGRQILIENVSSYISYRHSTISEWEFLNALTERADCNLLLDINNIYVSSFNHGFNPHEFLKGIPAKRVKQFHLAGHLNLGTHIVDTHDHPIIDSVWELYAEALRLYGPVSTLIERDDHIPELPDLVAELNQARKIAKETLGETLAVTEEVAL